MKRKTTIRIQWIGILTVLIAGLAASAWAEETPPIEPVDSDKIPSYSAARPSEFPQLPPIAKGKFEPSDASFQQNYHYPEWFRDAKFGIWSHWGPQAVPGAGGWYARKMYEHDGIKFETGKPTGQSAENKYHLEHYGHPSQFGYKDIIPLWKAEKFDPDALMTLFKKTGARYFVTMGAHHDNFFLWNSKIHRWNSVNMGPKKDIVGLWQQAAKKQGLRFGISEHLAATFHWFQTAHGADMTGPMAGVPYDGNDPQYQDLYHTKADHNPNGNYVNVKNAAWKRQWFDAVKEVVDLYQPDLVYSDSGLPFGGVGQYFLAHFYNQDMAKNGGLLEAVYACKKPSEGRWVRDVERGRLDEISADPWQTDTTFNPDWFYRRGEKNYRNAREIVQMLVDIVSKNGNLLLNVTQTPEGDVVPEILKPLGEIGEWLATNGECIYATRPFKVFGEGPSTTLEEKSQWGGVKEVPTQGYTAEDIRFTQSKDGATLYAIVLAVPQGEVRIKSLGASSKLLEKKIAAIALLGSDAKLEWKQEADALVIQPAAKWPSQHTVAFKIELSEQ
ncbi:MAG: alpha-L-fucosidase [bacterium]